MSKLNKSPQHVARLGRHSYQMQQHLSTSSPVGLLTPVYYDVLNPGEKVKIKDSVFTFTDAFNRYALNRFTEHIDYFFVPYDLLYTPFSSLRTNVKDIYTSMFKSSFVGDDTYAAYNFPTFKFKMISWALSYQLYNDTSLWQIFQSGNLEGYPTLLYQDSLRLLENCGIPVKDIAYSASLSDNVRENLSPIDFRWDSVLPDSFTTSLHILQAYQAVYQHWYRLSDYENLNQHSYNLDLYTRLDTDGTLSYNSQRNQILSILQPRYRPWKKDLFTNILPQPTFNTDSLNLFSAEAFGFDTDIKISPSASSVATVENLDSTYVQDSNYVADIRQGYMFEKYLQITQHAKKDYDSQILAHFGFHVPTDVKHGIKYIGSHTNRINVQGVEATAAGVNGASGSVLGELGSRGVGSRGMDKSLSFTAPCDGILIGIHSIVPESDYRPDGLDRLNTYKSWDDWFVPEFDKKGMVPFYAYEGNLDGTGQSPIATQRVAWRYPYSELKTKYDKATGALVRSRESYIATRNPFTFDMQGGTPHLSSVLHIHPDYTDPITLVNYSQDPNRFIHQGDDYNYNLPFETDSFVHSIDFDVVKTSTMSPYGLMDL